MLGEPAHVVACCGRGPAPIPIPVESRSSPPPSQGVGSASSDACSQRTRAPVPLAPATTRSCSAGIADDVGDREHGEARDCTARRRSADRIGEAWSTRTSRRASRSGRPRRSSSGLRGAVESTRTPGVVGHCRRLRGTLRARRPATACRLDRRRGYEARARPGGRSPARRRRRSRRPLHQRRAHDRRRAALLPRLRAAHRLDLAPGRRARRGRRGCLPGCRLRDPGW